MGFTGFWSVQESLGRHRLTWRLGLTFSLWKYIVRVAVGWNWLRIMPIKWPVINIAVFWDVILCGLVGSVISHVLVCMWIACCWVLRQSRCRWCVSGEQTSSLLWLGLLCCSELWQGKTGTRSCMTAWSSLHTAPQRTIIGRQTVGTSRLRLYTSAHFMLSLLTLCWTSWLVSASIFVECGRCWWKIWGFHGSQDDYCSLVSFSSVVVL